MLGFVGEKRQGNEGEASVAERRLPAAETPHLGCCSSDTPGNGSDAGAAPSVQAGVADDDDVVQPLKDPSPQLDHKTVRALRRC